MSGDEIRALRRARGWTQQQLADELYIGRVAVANWERGFRVPSTAHRQALECMFRGEPKPPPPRYPLQDARIRNLLEQLLEALLEFSQRKEQ